jgi:23S rRNA (pseudouridine1915-N3)-methyltransferase
MPIRIICLGKTRENWIKQGIEEYRKRLNPVWKIGITELKDVSLKETGSIGKVKIREAEIIRKAVTDAEYFIALDEKGKSFDSAGLAVLMKEIVPVKDIVFVIGGVYGLDKSITEKADLALSFSDFTFPHQLIRLILMEQLYRCWTIIGGKTYHY